MNRCQHCPISLALVCLGTDVRRFCELVDPGHKDHRPPYRDTLRSLAEGTAAGPFEPEIGDALVVDDTPCCGGTGAMPGIFDGL
jgi:hypothetical protein